MDPITMAIVAAITAGVAGGITDVGKQAIIDAYQGLKTLLKQKFGADSKVVKAVDEVEGTPDSKGRREVLQEEVSKAHVDQDADVLQAAQALLKQIQVQPGGGQHIQQVIGNYNAVADRGSSASVNVNHPREQ